jgi:hypothetical protein
MLEKLGRETPSAYVGGCFSIVFIEEVALKLALKGVDSCHGTAVFLLWEKA